MFLKMFGRKKDHAKITNKDPIFHVRLIGSTETFVASGRGCSKVPVQKLWDNSLEERYLKKVIVCISTTGIVMKETDKKDDTGVLFPIENISFCNSDTAVNEHIFSWIWKSEVTDKLECYAVLCSSKDKSHTMALVLSRAFQIAYKEWKASKEKEENRKNAIDSPRTPRLPLAKNGTGSRGKEVPSTDDCLTNGDISHLDIS